MLFRSVKMNVFLQFLYNEETLKENVRSEWIKEFDINYIDDTIIGGMLKNFSSVNDIIAMVEKKATGKVVQTTSLSASQTESKCIIKVHYRESSSRTSRRYCKKECDHSKALQFDEAKT